MTEKSVPLSLTYSQKCPINLFCVPNAGGTASMYVPWKALLFPSVRLHLLELAGRGRRFQDSFYKDMSEAVEDLYRYIEPYLAEGDFAFFGHSMGALLCYELIEKIRSRCNLVPTHAFLSGRVPPDNQEGKMLHLQPDAHLMTEIIQWGGLSAQQLADEALIRMFLPILRADLHVVEMYQQCNKKHHCLPCPVSILTGANDTIAQPSKMPTWINFTTQTCSFHVFPGGHFYLTECKDKVVQLIKTVLSPTLR